MWFSSNFQYLWIYTEHPRPHVLLKATEWLQQSVSAENLHASKSYNLSPVCTLDWLRAITLTKEAFFPLLPLPPPCLLPFSLPCVKLIL